MSRYPRLRLYLAGAVLLCAAALSSAGCADDETPLCVAACQAVKARIGHWWSEATQTTWDQRIDCSEPTWVEWSSSCRTCAWHVDQYTPTYLQTRDVPQCTEDELELDPRYQDAGLPGPG